MAASVSRLTQSQYFSPVFNTAVFDGPIRIYFAQKQESYALEVYFKISSRLRSIFGEKLNRHAPSLFVMIYPEVEGFDESFSSDGEKGFALKKLEKDHVVGVRGPMADHQLEGLITELVELYQKTLPQESEASLV